MLSVKFENEITSPPTIEQMITLRTSLLYGEYVRIMVYSALIPYNLIAIGRVKYSNSLHPFNKMLSPSIPCMIIAY